MDCNWKTYDQRSFQLRTPSEPDVREKDVIEYCNENNIFHVKIDGGSNKGLKEAFEYGPCSYILKKENNVESLIFRQLQKNIELQQEKYRYKVKQQQKEKEKFNEAINTLKDRVKERDGIILNVKEEKRLIEEQYEKLIAENESLNKEMLKLSMSKSGIIAQKTSVQKITAKLNINDDEFKKTLNILDHWLKIPSQQKSIQTNIICNMLENPRKIEQLKLDLDRHDELPSRHIISNLIDGTFATELKMDQDKSSRWFEESQKKTHQIFQDVMELHLFLRNAMFSDRILISFKRLMVQMIQKYPNPDGSKAYSPTQDFQQKMNFILENLKQVCSKRDCQPPLFSPKDLDIARRFEIENPKFQDDNDFKDKFQTIIYEQLEDEIRHLDIVLEDHETFVRPEI